VPRRLEDDKRGISHESSVPKLKLFYLACKLQLVNKLQIS
jgi:hypothetical protein